MHETVDFASIQTATGDHLKCHAGHAHIFTTEEQAQPSPVNGFVQVGMRLPDPLVSSRHRCLSGTQANSFQLPHCTTTYKKIATCSMSASNLETNHHRCGVSSETTRSFAVRQVHTTPKSHLKYIGLHFLSNDELLNNSHIAMWHPNNHIAHA